MEIITDILIVGGGPSGLLAAKEGCFNNNKVVLLDKDNTDTHNEYITKTSLRQIGIKEDDSWIVNQTNGFILEAMDEKLVLDNTTTVQPEGAYIIDKNKFIKALRDDIRENVEIIYTEAKTITHIKDKVVVEAENSTGKYTITTKILIIASGYHDNLIKQVGMDYKNMNTQHILQYELENTHLKTNNIIYSFNEIENNALISILPGKNNTASISITMKDDANITEILDSYIKSNNELRDSNIICKTSHILPSNGIIPKRVADNIILCGNSAGFVNPLTMKGLSGALESGTYAGVVAAKHVVFDEYKKDDLKQYVMYTDMLVNEDYERYMETREFIETLTLIEVYGILSKLSFVDMYECDIDSLIRTMIDESSKANIHLKNLYN